VIAHSLGKATVLQGSFNLLIVLSEAVGSLWAGSLIDRRCMILRSMPSDKKEPDIASASAPDTLAALHVDPEAGLTHVEANARLKEHGYNEVTERRGRPLLDHLAAPHHLPALRAEGHGQDPRAEALSGPRARAGRFILRRGGLG